MRLNLEGFEIEIRGDSFVCIEDGGKSLFCAWRDLDPRLQDAFKALAAEIEITVEKFVASDNKAAFDAVADEYEDPHQPCCGKAICKDVVQVMEFWKLRSCSPVMLKESASVW